MKQLKCFLITFIGALILEPLSGNCQNAFSELRLVYERASCNHLDRHFGNNHPALFIDYVQNMITDTTLLRYFEDRRNLIKVNQSLILENLIEFRDSNEIFDFHLVAKIKEKKAKHLGKIKTTVYERTKYVQSINGKMPLGFSIYSKKVKKIEENVISIDGSTIVLPDSVFNNLYFPNFAYKMGNILPAEVFYSKINDCFYLYLYGLKPLNKYNSSDSRNYDTFFSKIIVSKKGYLGQVSIPWGVLFGYNFDCGYFIGF